jgi:hypothetical protein
MKNLSEVLMATALYGGISIGLAQPAHADLVQNGQFTSLTLVSPQPGYSTTVAQGGQLGYNINANSWNMAPNGYTFVFNPSYVSAGVNGQYGNLSLWTSGDVNNPGNGGLGDVTPAPNGGNILASDGAFQLQPITQTITGLTPGLTYAVSFYYAGAQQYGFTSPTTEAWEVGLGGTIPGSSTPNTPILNNESHGFTGWQASTVDVNATSTSETLWFLAYGTPSGVPPFTLLSDISMEPVPAPEPSSLIGGGLVLLALGGSALRKFRKPKSA